MTIYSFFFLFFFLQKITLILELKLPTFIIAKTYKTDKIKTVTETLILQNEYGH